jgi:threonine dehydrogenase-like Zn-dependent dehydrogenase
VPRAGASLIFGAGTLGQLAVRAIRLIHDARVGVADPNLSKVERAIRAGAETGVVVPRQGTADEVGRAVARWADESLNAVIETSGNRQQRSMDRAPRNRRAYRVLMQVLAVLKMLTQISPPNLPRKIGYAQRPRTVLSRSRGRGGDGAVNAPQILDALAAHGARIVRIRDGVMV